MKIWKCYWQDSSEGNCQSWHPNERAARKELAQIKRGDSEQHSAADFEGEASVEPCGVEAINVPTNKAGLIAWLNQNFNTDNG